MRKNAIRLSSEPLIVQIAVIRGWNFYSPSIFNTIAANLPQPYVLETFNVSSSLANPNKSNETNFIAEERIV